MFEKIIARLTRMIKMDHTVYDEIAADEDATIEAAIIVAITALLSALGTLFISNFGGFLGTLIRQILVGWVLWSAIVWFVGSRLFAGNGTFWNVLRVLGYVTAPLVLGIIPIVGGLVGGILSLVLAFFAIRETMDLTTEKTVLTIIIGWAINLVIGLIF
ncbi:MAG: YIP1 family protein [Anaerolineae bacterium]